MCFAAICKLKMRPRSIRVGKVTPVHAFSWRSSTEAKFEELPACWRETSSPQVFQLIQIILRVFPSHPVCRLSSNLCALQRFPLKLKRAAVAHRERLRRVRQDRVLVHLLEISEYLAAVKIYVHPLYRFVGCTFRKLVWCSSTAKECFKGAYIEIFNYSVQHQSTEHWPDRCSRLLC